MNNPGKILAVLSLLLVLMAFCKKNNSDHAASSPASGTRLELSLDSLYLFARETYLWHQSLPDYNTFNPRQYISTGGDLECLQTELKAITALAVDPQRNKSYEYRTGFDHPLYSYVSTGNIITGREAKVNIAGRGNDLGLGMSIQPDNSVYINYVETGSPAWTAGLKRGMKVSALDNVAVLPNESLLDELLSQATLGFTVEKSDGVKVHVQLNAKEYNASPVFAATTIEMEGKKTGYLALARFSNLVDGHVALEAVFNQFTNDGVTDLVIDLRYNNGGYVETAEYVANLIAPAAINGAVMYEEHFNELLQQGKAPILKAIPYLDENKKPVYIYGRPATYADVDFSVAGNTYRFAKAGRFSAARNLVFIVSGITASASELLINIFKPYLNVKLVGSQTYGKPVGYFGIGIDRYTVYLAQFRMLNAFKAGDYYYGMPVDMAVADDVTRDFGDPDEGCLSVALNYLHNRNARIAKPGEAITRGVIMSASEPGMKEQRLRLK